WSLLVDDLRRDFGGVHAVNGVSFAVRAGGITGLIGPNGAGKSTVLTMIGGSIRPTAGSIRLGREEIAGRPEHEVARLGIVRTFLRLDEPMSGVNPTLARRIEEHLLDLRDQGLTMLMVEHELSVVERVCDPVVVMAQGRVIFEGSMAEVRSNEEVLDAYLVG